MKHILVATDFSENSKSAVLYAISLAKVFDTDVEVFNSFVTVPAIGIDGGPGVMSETIVESGIAQHQKRLDEFIADLDSELVKDVDITSYVGSGDPVISICDRLAEKNIGLAVMGTQGESRFEEIIFGSTTVDVMKQAICPVIAIPHNSSYYGFKKIVYATDLEEKDIEVIKHLCEFAEFFDAEVVVFHAFGEDNLTAQEEADEFNELLHQEVNYKKLKKESITYGNSHDAILEVIKKDLANLVVMREKKRGIFGRLFHPDMVKKINFHTTIPLLTYNDNSLKQP